MDPNTVVEATKYDPTVLYYTYSTIAQTLASAFAFVGAFILFYIQNVNQNCEKIADNIIENYLSVYFHNIKQILLAKGWGSFSGNFEEYAIKGRLQKKIEEYRRDNRREPTEDEKRNFAEEIKEKLKESYTTGYSPIEIENLWNKRCNLVKEFKSLAVFVAITIIASLILLSLSEILCNYRGLFWIPLVILILLSIYCVTKSVRIIWKTFSVPKNEIKS